MDRGVSRTIGWIVVAVACVVTAAASPVVPAQRDARQIYVSVTTDNSSPVTGLTAADFIVREDGLAREIVRVNVAPPPTHVALLFDDSASMQPALAELRSGLNAFANAIMGFSPQPQLAVTTFGERPTRQVQYTTSAEAIAKGIGRVFPRPNTGGYLLEAIIEEIAELRKRKAERPVIVVFVNEDGPEFSNLTSDRVRDALRNANASLWTIALQTQAPAMTTES